MNAYCCPHGDPYCPCQDGDSCHYEGRRPGICPTTEVQDYHCHVEGCPWPEWIDEMEPRRSACGLAKLGHTWMLRPFADLRGSPEWWCGAARNLLSDDDQLSVLIDGPLPRRRKDRTA